MCFYQNDNAQKNFTHNLVKISQKQTSPENIFEIKKRSNKSSEEPKTDKKNKAAFSRNFQKSYLKSSFIAANLNSGKNRHTTYPLLPVAGPRKYCLTWNWSTLQKMLGTAAIYIESFTIES